MIIGIGGVSRAGKTSLAFRLRDCLSGLGYRCFILHQDDYVTPKAGIPRIRHKTDWEDPSSLDFARFKNLIHIAANNNDIVIVEGILIFHDVSLVEKMKKHVMVEISWETFYKRKQTDFRWETEVAPDWYLKHIWDQHHKNGLLNFPSSGMGLNGSAETDMDQLLDYISEKNK